ncbi:HAD-IIA family hydrolase [Haloarchaeobius sp. TZWWS8]|uniref:HAD-IIA family hydrolase n=1 Tax=Haloarchaeobius sp. TZWWS8 TaxID=3446121 RepID=UPI003EC0ECF4
MSRFDGVILDVDGTVLRGDEALPGAPAAVTALREAGCSVCFFSNNPTISPEALAARLTRAGVETAPAEVLTSGSVTAEFLAADRPDDRLFVVGEDGFCEQLRTRGLELTGDHAAADTVVASIDRAFTYDDLKRSLWALTDDAVGFVGTDPDRIIPTAEGDAPGSGAIVNAVADVAGRRPEAILGKPHEGARDAALAVLDVPPERCLVVGDRLDTDIAMAEWTAMESALTLSGVTTTRDLASDVRDPHAGLPDHVVDSLDEVVDLL